MNDLYKDIYFKITDLGEELKAKQNNGYKYSIVSAVPFIDTKKYIKTKYEKGTLNNLTADTLVENVILLKPELVYRQENGIITTDTKITNLASSLAVRVTFDKDEYSTIYATRLNPSSFSITNFTEDLKIDGVIYTAVEYKTEQIDTANELENDTSVNIPFAIAYFYGDDKIEILHDQNKAVAFNFELRVLLDETDATATYSEINESTLHILDDGRNTQRTTLRNGFGVVGTKDKVLLSNNATNALETYDSYTKLNIMNSLGKKEYPQLALQFASLNDGKTWDGRRIEFIYTSGTHGANSTYFGIREVKGSKQTRGANFTLIGRNNELTENAYENGFVYSRDNYIRSGIRNMFVNSTDNTIINGDSNTFTNSKKITLTGSSTSAIGGETLTNSIKLASNNMFLNSKELLIEGRPKRKGGAKPTDAYIYNNVMRASFINSYKSAIKGGNKSNQHIHFINTSYSLNNTPHSDEEYSHLIMGGDYNFITDTSGSVIMIGNGLESIKNNENRVIIGNFNDEKNTNSGDVFIIADGGLKTQKLKTSLEQTLSNASKMSQVFESYSATNSQVYRHNLFTVNNAGYFRIKGNDHSWAQFGTSGLTAYEAHGASGKMYDIDYGSLYDKINVEDAVYRQIRKNEDLIKQYRDEMSTAQTTHSVIVNGNTNLNALIKDKPKNNDIVNVTFINDLRPNDTSLTNIITYSMNGSGGFGQRTVKLANGSSQSFMYVEDETNNMTGFSRINN